MLAIDTGSSSGREAGLALIETIVSMVTALLVHADRLRPAGWIVDQSSRETDYLQASQLRDTAIAHMTDELHSACFATGLKPIFEKSSGTVLIFEKTARTAKNRTDRPLGPEARNQVGSQPKEPGKVLETGKLDTTRTRAKAPIHHSRRRSPSWTKTILAAHVAKNTPAGESTVIQILWVQREHSDRRNPPWASCAPLATTLTAAEAEQRHRSSSASASCQSDGSEGPAAAWT